MPQRDAPGVFVEEVSFRRSVPLRRADVVAVVGHSPVAAGAGPVVLRDVTAARRRVGDGPGLGAAVAACLENGAREVVALPVPDDGHGGLGPTVLATAGLDEVSFHLLVLAPASTDAHLPDALVTETARTCLRRGAVLVLDTDPSLDPDPAAYATATAARLGDAAAATLLVHPRLLPDDGGPPVRAAPSVAGLVARSGRERGVWKAPAGTEATLAGVVGTSPAVPRDRLSAAAAEGVNPVRALPSGEVVLWGVRTLATITDPRWRYLPVRRLALVLERSIRSGLAWAVFEPNDEPLWRRLTETVEGLLHTLWRRGAFAGERPQDAYHVACDRSTTTRMDVDDGWAVVQVAFAPVRPAEFVVLSLRVAAGRL